MKLMAIDPGSSSGAIVIKQDLGITCHKMPDTDMDLWRLIAQHQDAVCLLENVGGSHRGNAAKSARTFAEHVGMLKMALTAAGIPYVKKTPQQWLHGLFGCSYPRGMGPKEVQERKKYVYAAMQRQYPSVKFHQYQADAMALLHYLVLQGDTWFGKVEGGII